MMGLFLFIYLIFLFIRMRSLKERVFLSVLFLLNLITFIISAGSFLDLGLSDFIQDNLPNVLVLMYDLPPM